MMDLNYNSSLPRFSFEIKDATRIIEFLDSINPPLFGDSNLVINGDFNNGLKFWKSNADSTTIDLRVENGKKCALIIRKDGNGGGFSLFHDGRNINFWANNNYEIEFKVKPVFPKNIIPFYVGYWINEGEGYIINLKQKIDTLNDGWYRVKSTYIFKKEHENFFFFPINSQVDYSKFYITDISLKNLTQIQKYEIQDLNIDKARKESNLSDFGRIDRWSFAYEIWKSKYKWHQKLLGHGFDYLEWYGEKFYDANRYDWPHNQFITVLLYSGILGLIFYLWFLYRVIKLYVIYRKKFGLIFIGFLITFFFSFFSAGNPFDPPVMGFFVMLPFLIDYVHKKDESN